MSAQRPADQGRSCAGHPRTDAQVRRRHRVDEQDELAGVRAARSSGCSARNGGRQDAHDQDADHAAAADLAARAWSRASTSNAQAAEVRRRIGYVPQLVSADGALNGPREPGSRRRGCTASRAPSARAHRRGARRSWACEAAADQLVRTYSGGMIRGSRSRRRCCTGPRCCSSTSRPIGLDPVARHAVWERLRELKRRATARRCC